MMLILLILFILPLKLLILFILPLKPLILFILPLKSFILPVDTAFDVDAAFEAAKVSLSLSLSLCLSYVDMHVCVTGKTAGW